ncbi:hypothetical protein [Nitrososphaera sp.]|uniref:hypothetical protein n=1 Tax=Nitrososphaera sp. TaxID=1971748 RepID=UPI002EDAEA57
MEWKIDRISVFISSVFTLFSLALIPALPAFDAFAATSFGTDYRHATTVSPGGTADTTTTVTVGSSITGTLIVNPYTSGSTATGTPSTNSLSGYGWRTTGAVGSSIPAGSWSFTVTTQASLISLLGNGKVKVYVYSTDTPGSNHSFIGSATGTNNVFAILTPQTETLSFSAGSIDLTNRVLVVEYWIDVTTGPLQATTITFQVASSTQTIVLPSSSGTFYLGKASQFSVGESESSSVSDAISRILVMARAPTDSAISTDSQPSRSVAAFRTASEASGAGITDSVSEFTGFARQIADVSGALVSEAASRLYVSVRAVSESSPLISDLLDMILNLINPPPSDDEDRRRRGGGGGGNVVFSIAEEPPVEEPPVEEPPPIEDENEVKNKHLNVRVSDSVGVRADENIPVTQSGLEVVIVATLNGISTAFQLIPPTAIGSVTIEITNNASSTEHTILHYWCVDERTGVRILEGAEEIALSPHQSLSKSFDITFLSPGQYSLEAGVSRDHGEANSVSSIQIIIPWIQVYLNLLIALIVGTIAAIGLYRLIVQQGRKKRFID